MENGKNFAETGRGAAERGARGRVVLIMGGGMGGSGRCHRRVGVCGNLRKSYEILVGLCGGCFSLLVLRRKLPAPGTKGGLFCICVESRNLT